MTYWQMAPPVSLPTRVTSVRSRAVRKSMMRRAMPRGLRSASRVIGRGCEPRGQVGATLWIPLAARRSTTGVHSWLSTSRPWTNTTGGAALSAGPAVREVMVAAVSSIRVLSGADLGVVGMGSSWAETGDEGIDAEAPASVDGAFRAAQSSRALGRGHALDEREEQVGDVGGVAG